MANNFKGEVFLNSKHKERFYSELNKRRVDMEDISARFIAILFLLTADEGLWKVSKDLIRSNVFDLKGICLKGIDTNGYVLYQTAKTLSDELNYLMKRLDSFDSREMEKFYATVFGEKLEKMDDLINLTFICIAIV